MDLSALQAAVAEAQNAGAAAATEIQSLSQQVIALHSNGPENVTQADLDSLAANVHAIATTLTTAKQTADADLDAPGGAVAEVATAGPTGETGATNAGPSSAAIEGPSGAPGGTSEAAATDAATHAGTDTSGRTMYVTTMDASQVDPAQWEPAPFHTTDGRQLYFFTGDTAPGDQNGAEVASWTVYTGGIVASA